MTIVRRITELEKNSGQRASDQFHVIFIRTGESNQDGIKRYCQDNDFNVDELKNYIYMTPQDAATL